MTQQDAEKAACTPIPVYRRDFNRNVQLPYGVTARHLHLAMSGFLEFLGFVNSQLNDREMSRLESMLMPANFSSIVGEFMISTLPKYCSYVVQNRYHNGHPDLIPAGQFPGDSVQHTNMGIEVKASRYRRGWQGHNPENTWLMVFVFDSNRPPGTRTANAPRPFRFVQVLGARLEERDWQFSGRSATSRRTITATVTPAGYEKMANNWIYQAPGL
jgi:hypothetical protein